MDRSSDDLVNLFDVDIVGENLPDQSWNIAPTQRIAVVIDSIPKVGDTQEPLRRLEGARWGLVPGWAKDLTSSPPLFNARSETVGDKPAFRAAVEKRRAVVPASGYYEWRTVDGVKVPQYITLPGDELLLFAGLYSWWKNPAAAEDSPDRWVLSTTILTRASAAGLRDIHERMPVFLDGDLVEEWLDPHEDGTAELVEQVATMAADVAERATFHEVDRAVGSVQNNSPDLVSPLA